MKYLTILLVLVSGCSVRHSRVPVEAYAITDFPQPDTDVKPVAPLNASQPRSVSGTLIISETSNVVGSSRLVYVASMESCAPCQSWKKAGGEVEKKFVDIEKPKPEEFTKAEWDVVLSRSPVVPTAFFRDRNGTLRFFEAGKRFSDWQLNWSMDKADEETSNQPVASASMGTIIDASESVKRVMDEWEQKLGDGTSLQITYDRSGAQVGHIMGGTFPSLKQLAGNLGRITADTDAPLAIKNISVGYRVFTDASGQETARFDIDPLTFNLSSKDKVSGSGGEVGIIPIFTIIQAASGIWQLFHPVCTVDMPGTMRLKATLSHRVITVDLETMPSVHFTAWFININPKLRRVEISEDSARLLFSGSVIKERTFKYSNMAVGGSSEELPTGWHSHRCDGCGHVWKHQNGLASWVDGIDITKEHTCAKCGREQWEQYDWNPK